MVAKLAWLGVVLAVVGLTVIRSHAQADPFPRTVIDAAGQSVTALAPARTVLLVGEDPVVERVLPPVMRAVMNPAAPDPVALEDADLLVIPQWAAAAYPGLLEQAGARGVPVFQTGSITDVAAWRAAVQRLGSITGQDARAGRMLAWLDAQLRAVDGRIAEVPPVRVLVLTPEGYTFGQPTLMSELIEAAGGINAAAEFDDFRQIDDAAIRALGPEAILLTPTWERSQELALRSHAGYAGIPAIRSGHVWTLPFSPVAPLDPGAAVLWLATRLHPDRFPPLDLDGSIMWSYLPELKGRTGCDAPSCCSLL